LAPEILKAMTGKPDMTKQDVWAIGVIAYQICTFNLPFVRRSYYEVMMAIINDPY